MEDRPYREEYQRCCLLLPALSFSIPPFTTVVKPRLLEKSTQQLGRHQHREENLPSQQGLGRETEKDIYLFAIKVIPPGSHFFILQYHVDSKAVEENEQRGNDTDDQGNGEALHRTSREEVQNECGDQRSNIRIDDG